MPYNHNTEMYDTFTPDPDEGQGVILWLVAIIGAIAVLLLWLF